LLAEGAVILPVSAALGIALGVAVAQMLVILLTGVFDPAPEAVVIPWAYVAMVTAAATVSTAAALAATHLAAQQHTLEVLRDL